MAIVLQGETLITYYLPTYLPTYLLTHLPTCIACYHHYFQFAFMSAHMFHVSRGNTTAVADVGMYSRCKSWVMNNCILPWNVEVFEQNPWDETVIANEGKARAYLRGGGSGGSNPPPKFSDFFLKSEGKEIERKRKKGMLGGGGGGVTS